MGSPAAADASTAFATALSWNSRIIIWSLETGWSSGLGTGWSSCLVFLCMVACLRDLVGLFDPEQCMGASSLGVLGDEACDGDG